MTAVRLQKILHILIGKTIKCTVQKAAVCHNTVKQTLHITVIRHIAAPFSRDIDFLSQFLILFIDRYRAAIFRRRNRSRHTGCPAADHDYFFHIAILFVFISLGAINPVPGESQIRRLLL